MKRNSLIRWLNILAIVFFITSIFASSSICKVDTGRSSDLEEADYFDKLSVLNHFNKYDASEITLEDWDFYNLYSLDQSKEILTTFQMESFSRVDSSSNKVPMSFPVRGGLMDSAWPMYCHDTRHTGRSPYSTVDTWDEIWRFKQHMNDFVRGSPVIGDDGTIYFGGADFYALYPNGTLKWKYDDLDFYVWSAPAIDENGVLYVGDLHGYFYAINADGSLKWRCLTGDDILSSPAIGDDGTIFVGDGGNWHIKAFNPNGTLKWAYKTGHIVYSSPAIGDDGTIYCGSHDTYLYALYPNNGTLKWRYKTDHWIRTSPCIGDDGTIYVVSLDSHLHAVNPDGSLKWKTNMGEGGTSPTIGQDGTIYAGYTKLHAVNPINGSVKWTFDVGGKMKGSTPCHSLEDTIYFGTDSGWLYAVNSDGTLKWRENIANAYVDSSPAIAEDGTLYVGSAWLEGGYSKGYLHAFGIGELKADANGPYYGLINEPAQFEGKAKGGYSPHSYHWDFGDTYSSDEQNPIHTYTSPGNYTVTLTVTDDTGNTSSDTSWAWIQDGNTPPNKPSIEGPPRVERTVSYDYKFMAIDPDGTDIWFYVNWGDTTDTGFGPCSSGTWVTKSHKWDRTGTYSISCKVKDPYGAESGWTEFEVIVPRSRDKATYNPLFLRFLERFPILEEFISQIISPLR